MRQEKKMLKTLEEAKQAEQQGDKIKASQLFAEARQHQQTINTQNELIAELKKKQVEREKMAKELTQEIDNPWYKDLNFSSWQVWIILLASLIFLYLLYRACKWAYGKFFSSE